MDSQQFQYATPSLETYWRAIILFGRNVASYKFALAKSLMEAGKSPTGLITLGDLAGSFSRHICEHLRLADKQATSPRSRFLDACRRFNKSEITKQELIETTVRLGFQNVIDAFHVVNQQTIAERFFIDERKAHNGIRITDQFYRLLETSQQLSFPQEIEARWRLVETAWELNIARRLVTVSYDSDSALLFTDRPNRRTNITSSRDALNGYQKGKCFYCFKEIGLLDCAENMPDVDHFFPHVLKGRGVADPIDGVWNLVLACQPCNRGENGKSARIPSLQLLERLHTRNEYLINSHHPLRETLIQQTGQNKVSRQDFLQTNHKQAIEVLIHTWEPEPNGPEDF